MSRKFQHKITGTIYDVIFEDKDGALMDYVLGEETCRIWSKWDAIHHILKEYKEPEVFEEVRFVEFNKESKCFTTYGANVSVSLLDNLVGKIKFKLTDGKLSVEVVS
jgi:hypothetical protein